MILLINAIGAHHDEIEMKSFDFIKLELDYERDDELYFTTKGRKLTSSKGKRKKGKGKVNDLRMYSENDIRFLDQFKSTL